MPEPAGSFPAVELWSEFRRFAESAPLARTAADFKTMVTAYQAAYAATGPFLADVGVISDLIASLFGNPAGKAATARAGGGLLGNWREDHMVHRCKQQAQALYREGGLESIKDDIAAAGLTPKYTGKAWQAVFNIDVTCEEAKAKFDVRAFVLEKLHAVEGFTELIGDGVRAVEGGVWDRIKEFLDRALGWLAAHKDQIIAIAKAILMALVFFGFL